MIIIGHRGMISPQSGIVENTYKSFEKALDLGVDMIELDVYLTRDHRIVVCHDHTLDRLCQYPYKINTLTLSEVQQLPLHDGSFIPTLSDVIELVNKRVPINIEIKAQSEAICPILIGLLEIYFSQGWKKYHFLVSSFDMTILQNIYTQNSQIPLGVIQSHIPSREDPDYYLRKCQSINAVSIHIDYSLCYNPDFYRYLSRYHEDRLHVYLFVINDPKIVLTEIEEGLVDGIITDHPELFLSSTTYLKIR